jgi:hypothetical protein
MKYLHITEYDTKDGDAFMKKNNELSADREKNPKKYPQRIISGLMPITEWPKLSPDSVKFVDILEADEEQIENHTVFWYTAMVGEVPSVKKWYVPLIDTAKTTPKFLALRKK